MLLKSMSHQLILHSYPFYFLGRRYVLMNHHMLLHLKKSVADHGPLWCTSLFVFEDWNGDLDSFFHGTQNIAGQVSYKISVYADVPWPHFSLTYTTNFLFEIQIMTAVVSHQQLPKLIKEMPPGQAKDIVMRLRGHSEKCLDSRLQAPC